MDPSESCRRRKQDWSLRGTVFCHCNRCLYAQDWERFFQNRPAETRPTRETPSDKARRRLKEIESRLKVQSIIQRITDRKE